jgi:hypothetical protein
VTERVLTQRELNRALLARQLLLERSRLSIPRALERVGGIQMQYAPSGYVGLWTRLDGFERDALTRALERRTVVGTFLVDGAVAGTWRVERDRIVTEAFARLPRAAKRELDTEAERLRAFHA